MNGDDALGHKLTNLVHSLLLLGGMAGLLGVLGWMIAGPSGVMWTVLLGILSLLFAPRVSPHLVLRLYGARRLSPATVPGLYQVLVELARRAELPRIPTLYYVPSRVLNAFTVGSRQDAAIAMTDGMFRALNLREATGVLAHELSHIRNNDTWVMGLADLVSRLISMLSLVGIILLVVSLPLMLFDGAPFPLFALLVLIVAPNLSALLQTALSRTREYDADLDAATLTGDPRGLAMALGKLERYQGGWLERLLFPGRRVPDPSVLRTHPPTEERIRRLLSLEREPMLRFYEPLSFSRGSSFDVHGYPPITRMPRRRIGGLWF